MCSEFGLYLHIPFCKSKCAYCDFFSGKGNEADYDAYTQALIHKISLWSSGAKETVTSVYFGGGTPSILGSERLCRLLSAVKGCFTVAPAAEITLEVNPESGVSLDFEKLFFTGFNRISVGLQSAIAREIHLLGRIHTPNEAAQIVLRAQKAGFEKISLDLMLGIPHQTTDTLRQSVTFCAGCGVKHISAYILKIEENTPFFAAKNTLPLPSEDEQADLYLYAVQTLEALGYRQYEISNFAFPSFESKHNTLYWHCGEYLGIGPSAHSFYQGKRFYYPRDMQKFLANDIIQDGSGGDESEYIMLALRLKEGFVFSAFSRRFQKPVSPFILKKMHKYAQAGYMEVDEKHACFTPKGFLVSNTILSDILLA